FESILASREGPPDSSTAWPLAGDRGERVDWRSPRAALMLAHHHLAFPQPQLLFAIGAVHSLCAINPCHVTHRPIPTTPPQSERDEPLGGRRSVPRCSPLHRR